jgi:hypothetical protein
VPLTKRIRLGVLRHRAATLGIGLVLALGIVGLSAHKLLPEHHTNTQDVICIASLVIAVSAACVWAPLRQPLQGAAHFASAHELGPTPRLLPAPVTPASRAGPPGSVVRRR